MSVSYLSCFDYINSPEGLEFSTLLGNAMRLSSAVVAGATSLPVTPATTVNLNQFDIITIYDGLSSEQVMVSSATAAPASSIPVMALPGSGASGLQYTHAQYTACSSPGTQGDLGGEILKASAWLENITKQSLWSTTQTENLRMPTLRASLDNQGGLNFRTRQYPITQLSSLYLGLTLNTLQQYDQTQAVIDINELVNVPQLVPIGSGGGGSSNPPYVLNQPPFSRRTTAWCQVTYTAGYSVMPADVKDACILLVNSLLSRRQNAGGFDQMSLGKKQIVATQRGDMTGMDLHEKRARNMLANYSLRIF
jgi:hypothetical protein